MTVIDGSNMIMGRLASNVAQRLLKREVIHIVNAEKIVMTGTESSIMARFRTRLEISPKANPHNGPKYSRMPDKIVKYAVRGMLPWKAPRGKTAFRNLRVHIGVPEELGAEKQEKVENAQNRHGKGFLVIGDISRALGAKF